MDALKEIANASNTTLDEADRKLRNIHSQYLCGEREKKETERERKEKRKRKKESKKEKGAEKQFHIKWFGHLLVIVLMPAIPLCI
jgi:hypothetical protein